jgi:hypothetical protein
MQNAITQWDRLVYYKTRRKQGNSFFDSGSLHMTPKVQATKVDKRYYMKMRSFCRAKDI